MTQTQHSAQAPPQEASVTFSDACEFLCQHILASTIALLALVGVAFFLARYFWWKKIWDEIVAPLPSGQRAIFFLCFTVLPTLIHIALMYVQASGLWPTAGLTATLDGKEYEVALGENSAFRTDAKNFALMSMLVFGVLYLMAFYSFHRTSVMAEQKKLDERTEQAEGGPTKEALKSGGGKDLEALASELGVDWVDAAQYIERLLPKDDTEDEEGDDLHDDEDEEGDDQHDDKDEEGDEQGDDGDAKQE